MKVTYKRLTANIFLNAEKLRAFPLRSGTQPGCPLSPLLFNMVLEVLASAIRQHKGIKKHPNGLRRSQTFTFCRQHDTLHGKPKESTKRLLELIHEFSKVTGYKINVQKSIAFLCPNMKQQKEKSRN